MMNETLVELTSGQAGRLSDEHERIFQRALMNVLSTEVAEYTYAQILDGLPTVKSLRESYVFMSGHPVHEINHEQLCPGFLEKAREFRAQFNPSDIYIEQSVSQKFHYLS